MYSKLFQTLLLFACAITAQSANLGEPCPNGNDDCKDIVWGYCDTSLDEHRCMCESNRVPHPDVTNNPNKCVLIQTKLHGSCSEAPAVQCIGVLGSSCSISGTCECNAGTHVNDPYLRACLPKVNSLHESCFRTVQCQPAHSSCSVRNGTMFKSCNCLASHLEHELPHEGCIEIVRELGKPCRWNIQCETGISSDARCGANDTCECPAGTKTVNGKCYRDKKYGERCEVNEQCTNTGTSCLYSVPSGSPTCQCPYGTLKYLPEDSNTVAETICKPIKKIGDDCTENLDCSHSIGEHSSCSQARKCICSEETVVSNNGTNCLEKNVKPGDPCDDAVQCAGFTLDSTNGVFCNPHKMCSCLVGFERDGETGCKERKYEDDDNNDDDNASGRATVSESIIVAFAFLAIFGVRAN